MGGYIGEYIGDYNRVKGDTQILDYGSHVVFPLSLVWPFGKGL